jgi:ribonucleotide monophosphatase NagD (HAD superfamily)
MGGKVIMAGKPHAPIYELCLDALETHLGQRPLTSDILCIGDAVNTDILGAQNMGMDALFIASGLHREVTLNHDTLDIKAITLLLSTYKTKTRYISKDLRWA